MYRPQEEAFWVFVCLMEYDGLAGFYRENFPLLGKAILSNSYLSTLNRHRLVGAPFVTNMLAAGIELGVCGIANQLLSHWTTNLLVYVGRYTHAFDELLARELPDLRDHFTEEGVQPTLYIHQW